MNFHVLCLLSLYAMTSLTMLAGMKVSITGTENSHAIEFSFLVTIVIIPDVLVTYVITKI